MRYLPCHRSPGRLTFGLRKLGGGLLKLFDHGVVLTNQFAEFIVALVMNIVVLAKLEVVHGIRHVAHAA